MRSPNMSTGSHRRARRCAVGALIAVSAAVVGAFASVAPADAAPLGARYVNTIRCDSANPWPGAPLRIFVDVYTGAQFPSDGLPGPAISLSAMNPNDSRPLEMNTVTTVRWTNRTTGRSGVVRVPTRGTNASWDAVLHPGHGDVGFTITQKIGALAFFPMVNPQHSSCRGSATL